MLRCYIATNYIAISQYWGIILQYHNVEVLYCHKLYCNITIPKPRLTSDHRLMTLLPARECHRPMMPQERSDEQIHNQSAHNQDGHSDKQSKWGWQKLVYNCEESYYPSVRLTSCLHWYPVNKNYISDPSINTFVEHINIKTASNLYLSQKATYM